jgi:osmotically-inducible protein OsmY
MKRLRVSLQRALLALSLAAAPLAAVACASDPSARSTGEYVDDKVVSAKVKAALVGDPTTKAYQIGVTTYEGVVQLSGFVDSTAQVARATEVARSVDGVREVKNELQIR